MDNRPRIDPPLDPDWVEARVFSDAASALHRELDLQREDRRLFTTPFRVGFLLVALVGVLALVQSKDNQAARELEAEEHPYRPQTVSLADCPEVPDGAVPLLFLTVRLTDAGASVERCFRPGERPVELQWLSR